MRYTTAMVLYGTNHRVGDQITTAQIIAPDLANDDPALLAAYCLAAVDPTLAESVAAGDILLAGHDFGVGDQPEAAVLALQALGFAAILCVSAAETFVEQAEMYGLPVIVAPDAVAAIAPAAVIRLDLVRGTATDRTTGISYAFAPCPPALLARVRHAALLAGMRRVVDEEGFDG